MHHSYFYKPKQKIQLEISLPVSWHRMFLSVHNVQIYSLNTLTDLTC